MLKSRYSVNISNGDTKHHGSKRYGIVNDVILNDTDVDTSSIIPDMEGDSDLHNKLTTYIGAVRIATPNDGTVDEEEFKIAFPYDRNSIKLPVINETVELIELSGVLYYKLIEPSLLPTLTATENLLTFIKNPSEFNEGGEDPISSYSSSSKTGIPNNPQGKHKKDKRFGKYYKVQDDIHRLKLFEGDWLMESRFGQSIRFNGYDENEKFAPTIFIRNNESGLSRKEKKVGELTLEDINRDGSSIVLSSGDRILNFLPGTVSKSFNSDFKTQPDSFRSYPNILKGDQVLISSGRLILSSRSAETIIWSKKNIGIISDENFSFDLGKGIIGSVLSSIVINTNDTDVILNTGTGRIHLGEPNSGKPLEPIVLGDTLLGLLENLIDAINQQSYATPSGPTSVGPLNRVEFQSIRRRLREILSTQNKTI